MNKIPAFLLALVLAAFGSSMQASAATGSKGYEAFKTVRTRNIFDPNRRPVREAAPPQQQQPRSPSQPRTRSSTFTLTGTMVREGRSLAFFSGSRTEFSKVISVGDSVANYKITAIEPAQVSLEHDGKTLTLALGTPFRIDSSTNDPVSPDEPPDKADPEDPSNPPAGDGASRPPTPAVPTGSDAKSEILRRMMERRAQEMNK